MTRVPRQLSSSAQFVRSAFALSVLLAAAAPGNLGAQVAGQNVNMVSGTQWPGGDPFLQRQNEPSLDVSTRNPLHLVAGANDYRTVDIPFDAALPGETNAGDAWLGLFKSLDGGRTWKSTLLPGYPQDGSPEGLASPLKGLAAAADPTIRAGAGGVFLYSGIAFNRGTNAPGVLFVARFIDNNDKENGDATRGRDPIKYAGTVVVDTGTSGQFLDKPTLAFDVPRPGDAPCTFRTPKDGGGTLTQSVPGGRAYLAYTMFVGGTNNINTKILVASSTDCGATWGQPVKVNSDSHINQGAALAIDPGTGALTLAWRRFAAGTDPNAIAVSRSTDGGKNWTVPKLVAQFPSYDPASPGAPTLFDQGTTSGSMRTNAYPALATDGTGRLYLAWSQRGVGPGGDARVVLSTSKNGTAWSTPQPVDNDSILDDEGSFFTTLSGRGHQLMPALKFAAGKLMVLYYDLRLDHTVGIFSPVLNAPSPAGLFFTETRQPRGELPGAVSSVFTPFLTDAGLTLRRHTIDVRVAQADPAASPTFSSARVSRYVYGSRPGETTIEQLQINPPNLPMFRQGTVPFLGDYIDIAGPPTFVPQPGGTWAWNTAPAKDAVFHAAWTDNRDVRAPKDGNWANYTPVGSTGGTSLYDPTQSKPLCLDGQAGMRNQNIYTAKITQGLVVTTPSNAKQLTTAFPRLFAAIVQNLTEKTKSYRLTIANQPVGGAASFLRDALLTTVDVSLAPRSGASRPVFITSTDPKARVTVNVAEIAAPAGGLVADGLTGSVVYNPDVSNPDVSNPDVSNPDVSNPDVSNVEVYTPDVSNPDVSNPDVSNPDVSNPDVSNPDVSNPDVSNPDVSNIGVANPDVSNPDVSNPDVSNPDVSNASLSTTLTDANYRVVNNGNTAATYRVRLFGNPPASAKLQLILTKVYATPVLVDCTLTEQPQNTLVTNIVHPVFTTDLGTLPDPGTTNSDVSNATMTLAPGETGLITLRGTADSAQMQEIVSQITPAVVPHGAPTDGRLVPGYFTPLFIATTSLPDGVIGQAYASAVVAIGGKTQPYVFSVPPGSLPAGLTLTAVGTLTGTPTGPSGTSTFTVQVADSSLPPRTTMRTLAIRVVAPLALTAGPLSDAVLGQPYSASVPATGGSAPYVFSISTGTLPSGVTLSEAGVLSGTPSGSPGTSTFTVQIADSTSPTPQTTTQTFSLTVNKGATTTTVTSNPGSSVFGQPVTLTASVSVNPPGTGSPTGSVTFSEGSTTLGTGTISGGVATLTTPALAVGNHSITATYGGDASFAASTSAALGQAVGVAASAATVSSSAPSSAYGQVVTFTATITAVAPGAGTPTGTVAFLDGGTSLGTAALVNGVATLEASLLPGTHPISVSYAGDGNFGPAGASNTLAQTVGKSAPTTSLTASPTASVWGQPVTLSASVSTTPGLNPPAGTATFKDGATVLGTSALSGGGATLGTSALSAGSHSITATYNGDTSYASSTSAPITVTVAKATTSATLTSGLNPSQSGNPVQFTASIAVTAPGAGIPTGTVTFLDGSTSLGTGTVTGGVATFTTSSLAIGAHVITASYGGNGNVNGSSSGPLTQNVFHTTYTFTGFLSPLATAGTLSAPSYSGTATYGNAQRSSGSFATARERT